MTIPLKINETLKKRYKINHIIGQGGMGNIYLAEDMRLQGRQCALKEIEYDQSLEKVLLKQARSQFKREATVLATLDHPNLPKVSDFFSTGSRDYLVMDYVPGDDLRALMLQAKHKKTFLDTDGVLKWAEQLADTLTYLHTQDPPIIHRDIKPSNLKITPNGLLKLVDFGLVKISTPGDATITIIRGQGTALYTPLEQYGSDTIHTDLRSDIYSFGSTLYHLLTNTPPVNARERFLEPDQLIMPRNINPKIPTQVEKAILWAMKLHPDDRPTNVNEFIKSLLGKGRITINTQPSRNNLKALISNPLERNLFWISITVSFISLLTALFIK
ncbi:MAG TPA: serine/threonine protein kinase [Anaerolineae bacterium]|nr:serine/threonine protein kinase [Anaerolineae bacterium]